MPPIRQPDPERPVDDATRLIVRSWLTHDAMWFTHAVDQVGIEVANQLNRAAIRAAARIEVKRLLEMLELDGVRGPTDLRRLFQAGRDLFVGDLIDMDWQWSDDGGSLTVDIRRCFAHDGVTRLGVIDRYECGIYERMYGWLEGAGVSFLVAPDTLECLLHHRGRCRRRIEFDLPSQHVEASVGGR